MTKQYLTFEELRKTKLDWIEKVQNRRFRAMMRHCYFNHEFIHNMMKKLNVDYLDFHTPDDWQRLGMPLIRKKDYIDNPAAFLVNPKQEWNSKEEQIGHLRTWYKEMGCYSKESRFLLKKGLKYIVTGKKETSKTYNEIKSHAATRYYPYTPLFSGGRTTGNPSASFLSRPDMKILQNNSANIGKLVWFPYMARDIKLVAMNLFPALPHLGFWGVHLGFDAIAMVNLPMSPGLLPTEKLVYIAEKFGANGLAGIPSFIRNRFIPLAKEKKAEFAGVGGILMAGERIYERTRKDVQEGLEELGMKEARVLGGYASSETKHTFFGECCHDDHFNSGYHNAGPLSLTFRTAKITDTDENGNIVDYEFTSPPEGGLMTLFHLDGTGTIFEGYLQGDLIGSVIEERCSFCGMHVRTLMDISRSHETDFQLMVMGLQETKVKGATVNLTNLRETLLTVPGIREVQVVIDKQNHDINERDIIIIRASKEEDTLDKQLHEAVLSVTKREAEVTPKVEFWDHEDLLQEVEALKFAWIQDLRARYQNKEDF
ncbi:MAG: phenylacetate--CoA ligase family protein [Candidatus Hodarchaeales archaeon]